MTQRLALGSGVDDLDHRVGEGLKHETKASHV
jgi:hypothetical protein